MKGRKRNTGNKLSRLFGTGPGMLLLEEQAGGLSPDETTDEQEEEAVSGPEAPAPGLRPRRKLPTIGPANQFDIRGSEPILEASRRHNTPEDTNHHPMHFLPKRGSAVPLVLDKCSPGLYFQCVHKPPQNV